MVTCLFLKDIKMTCGRGQFTDVNGDAGSISIPQIEVQLEVLSSITNMIASNKTQCTVNNIVIQNGLTTQQVSDTGFTSCISISI